MARSSRSSPRADALDDDGHDVYEVLPDGAKSGSEILIPAIDSIVLNIDVKKKRMVVRPLKGMVEE